MTLVAPLIAATVMAAAMLKTAGATDPELQMERAGGRAVNVAPAQNFTGDVKVEMLYSPVGTERASAGTVSFAPGAPTAWHSHPLGQTLVVTAGIGRIQR
jgi:4-carboxymuconolactone decarboxylase